MLLKTFILLTFIETIFDNKIIYIYKNIKKKKNNLKEGEILLFIYCIYIYYLFLKIYIFN